MPIVYNKGEKIIAETKCTLHGHLTIESHPLENTVVIDSVRCPFCSEDASPLVDSIRIIVKQIESEDVSVKGSYKDLGVLKLKEEVTT